MKNLLEKINNKLNDQGGFLKAVSILAGGTAFAQILGILTLPILTRLYSPEEFSVFAIYSAILGAITVISCLRFDIAIPIPDKDSTAINLIILSLLSDVALTLILILIIFFYNDYIFSLFNNSSFIKFIWLIPIGFFLSGLYNTFQFWHTRKKNFKIIAETRVFQSVSSSIIQILMGVLGAGVLGLIIGQIINFAAGVFKLILRFRTESLSLFKNINIRNIKSDFKEYDKFPKFSTLEALAHSSSMHLPIVVIGTFLLGPEAGYILLAMKVMTIPMSLIGNSIAQVYLANAPKSYRNGELFNYSLTIVKKILKISLIPILLIGIGSYFLFTFFFGEEWAPAGKIAIYLIPWILMQLLSSPITMALHVIGKQKIAMLLHFFGFFIRVIILIIIGFTFPYYLIEYFAFSGFIFYLLYLIVILNIIHKSENKFL